MEERRGREGWQLNYEEKEENGFPLLYLSPSPLPLRRTEKEHLPKDNGIPYTVASKGGKKREKKAQCSFARKKINFVKSRCKLDSYFGFSFSYGNKCVFPSFDKWKRKISIHPVFSVFASFSSGTFSSSSTKGEEEEEKGKGKETDSSSPSLLRFLFFPRKITSPHMQKFEVEKTSKTFLHLPSSRNRT